MWPTPRWPRSPGPSGWPRGRSRPSSTGAARPWPPASRPAGRTTMLEERLRRAAGALERSVAEVDAIERLQALDRRRRRQRTTTTVLTLIVAAAVLAGAVFAVGIARRIDPQPGPPARPATQRGGAPPGGWRGAGGKAGGGGVRGVRPAPGRARPHRSGRQPVDHG